MFLYAFAKSERENLDPDELAMVRKIAADLLAANAKQIEAAVRANELQEISNEKEKP